MAKQHCILVESTLRKKRKHTCFVYRFWLPGVRYEAQPQKFVSNARYLREMPHRTDSESQTSSKNSYGRKHGSVTKSGNKPGLKFPVIDNLSVKRKLKHNIAYEKKKREKGVHDPNKVTSEDSDKEDQCRICQVGGGSTNPLLRPCGCVGSLQFVWQECLKERLKAEIKSVANLGAVKAFELCKQNLIIDTDNFNVNAYYRNHQKSRHGLEDLYEDCFAELTRLNNTLVTKNRVCTKTMWMGNSKWNNA
ncbi:probable E3 ubiquitin-protein ligase MARCHF10 isoform X2 [Anser cygnoides]|uniref:probable E3 ubiquitin-protein ligase MARCHF10 isoform X2 n=1 Tax=Anser cygnoides TaxID=8845 RepID=UPI0034D31C64